MAAHKNPKGLSKGQNKTFASKRTLNPGSGGHPEGQQGASSQQQDPQRRLGGFETTGEHARTGSRGHQ